MAAAATAAADRILEPYFDSPFFFAVTSFSWPWVSDSRANLVVPWLLHLSPFFSMSSVGILLMGGSNLSGFVCGSFPLSGCLIHRFGCSFAFLTRCLSFQLWGEKLDFYPLLFGVLTVLILWSQLCIVGWEQSWVVRTISPVFWFVPLDICSRRGYGFAAEAGPGLDRRRRRRLGAKGEGEAPLVPAQISLIRNVQYIVCGLELGVFASM